MDGNYINGIDPCLGSTPVVRCGDSVFLLNQDFSSLSIDNDLMKYTELRMLAYDNYRCPFDFLTEFPQWFEWHSRVHFHKQTTGKVTTSMISDVARIKSHKIEREIKFTVMADFTPLYRPTVVFNGSTS